MLHSASAKVLSCRPSCHRGVDMSLIVITYSRQIGDTVPDEGRKAVEIMFKKAAIKLPKFWQQLPYLCHAIPTFLALFKTQYVKLNKSHKKMVPGGGLEPPQCHHRRILSPLRLPIPPSRHDFKQRHSLNQAAHYARKNRFPQ